MVSLAIINLQVLATICFKDLKLPRLIAPDHQDKDTVMQAAAASDQLNALFVGGMAESDRFKVSSDKAASVFRLDLA